jgi:hypothetical protein
MTDFPECINVLRDMLIKKYDVDPEELDVLLKITWNHACDSVVSNYIKKLGEKK